MSRELTDAEEVKNILQPTASEAIAFHRVSNRVGNAKDDDVSMIEPLEREGA